ncbi:zinc knuckle [Phlyctema vagabunda]|uniref:Zinc knuckle n=1 Tax=Phlyctema vagabunda TaxID=108571 RepID=A0ABR4P229_9HELO
MVPSSTSTPNSGGKAMSSRLLTMKFMQRAAASSPTPNPPATPEEPSSKRRKVKDESPSKFSVDALADQRAIQAAIAEEEAKRQAALERQGAELGDTRWVLNFEDGRNSRLPPAAALRVIQAGFANLDNTLPIHVKSAETEDVSEDKPVAVGRKSFGKFNRVLEKQQNPNLVDSSESDSDDSDSSGSDQDSEDDIEEDATSALIKESRHDAAQRAKAERKAKRKAEKAGSLELAKKRKKKDVKLNSLTSLTGRQDKVDSRTCHKCGGVGHLLKECPKNKRPFQGGDDGPRKARKTR